MTGTRWWHVFFGATMLVLAIVAWTAYSPSTGHRIAASATIVVLTVCWLSFGQWSFGRPRLAIPFAAVLILGSGVLVAGGPSLAVVQAISMPLVWAVLERTAWAVTANVCLALAVAVGYVSVLGPSPEVFLQAAFIEGISLVGSLALGVWTTRIAQLSDERKLLLDELTAAQAQLATLHRDSGVTSERERLAREIHDTIAQSLTGLVMLAQRSRRQLAAGELNDLPDQLAMLEEGGAQALAEARTLIAATAPPELDAGIGAALERLAARFSRETGIAVTATVDEGSGLDQDVRVVLLRCAQESLANVRKHSRAAAASVTLAVTEDGASLTVYDEGIGFDPQSPSTGFGLSGMRDRLSLVGGQLTISSSAAGTTVSAHLPLTVTA